MKQAVWLAAALMMLLPLGKVYSKERSERENNTLRIMSYNIRNGRGMDDVADFRRTAAGSFSCMMAQKLQVTAYGGSDQ